MSESSLTPEQEAEQARQEGLASQMESEQVAEAAEQPDVVAAAGEAEESSSFDASMEQRAEESIAAVEASKPQNATREVPVSTVLRMMGVASESQLDLVASKVDLLTAKVSTAIARIDALSSVISDSGELSLFDKIDFQLTEVRNILKNILPEALVAGPRYDEPPVTTDAEEPSVEAVVSEDGQPEPESEEQEAEAATTEAAEASTDKAAETSTEGASKSEETEEQKPA